MALHHPTSVDTAHLRPDGFYFVLNPSFKGWILCVCLSKKHHVSQPRNFGAPQPQYQVSSYSCSRFASSNGAMMTPLSVGV